MAAHGRQPPFAPLQCSTPGWAAGQPPSRDPLTAAYSAPLRCSTPGWAADQPPYMDPSGADWFCPSAVLDPRMGNSEVTPTKCGQTSTQNHSNRTLCAFFDIFGPPVGRKVPVSAGSIKTESATFPTRPPINVSDTPSAAKWTARCTLNMFGL